MDDRRVNREPEPELERLLSEGLSTPPPEEVLRQITPWHRAIKRILIGLVLETITLNFFGLNYILPVIGQVFILLGLRTLRRETRAFHVCWYAVVVQTGVWAFWLIRQAALGWQAFYRTTPGELLTELGFVLKFIPLICLWLGLRAVRRGAGLNPGVKSGVTLLIFYCVLFWLAMNGPIDIGWLFFFALLAVYLCIIRSLYKLSRELDEAGYTLRPIPVWVPDWLLAGVILGALLLGIVTVSLACNRLPMEWQPVDPSEQSQVEDIKAQLQELGFPEEVLADLSAEDIRSCVGALRVVSDVDTHALSPSYTDKTPKPLKITSVAVELDGDRMRWRIFHHFQWETGTSFYGTEAMQLWPAYRIDEGWAKSSDATGRVLYDRDGTTFWSHYYFLGEEMFTANDFFFGDQTSIDLFAAFSFPRHGERCRGYVTYETAAVADGAIIDSWVNYAHARKIIQYPAISAQEWIQTRGFSSISEPFRFVQDALQFYPQFLDEEDFLESEDNDYEYS